MHRIIIHKLAETGTESVCAWLGIYLLVHIIGSKLKGVPEKFAYRFGHITAQVINQEFFADIATAAFISEYICPRINIMYNLAAVIYTSICACAQYSGETFIGS